MTDPLPPTLDQRIRWTPGFRSETDRTVLRALVRHFLFRPDGSNVRPSLKKLVEKSQVPRRSVLRALLRLKAAGFLEGKSRHRWPTIYRICLDRLATEDPERLRVVPDLGATVALKNGSECHGGTQNETWHSKIRPESDEVAPQYDLEEEDLYAAASEVPMECQSGTQTVDFLTWWRVTYPLHNDGAQSRATEADAAIATELLATYALDRLQAMSLFLWQVTTDGRHFSDRWWIAEIVTERSLRVLRHKAAYLDKASRLGAPGATQLHLESRPHLTDREIREAEHIRSLTFGCPHEPRHGTARECVLEIAYARRG